MYYPCSENKGTDRLCSCAVTAQLICAFVFTLAKLRFPHDAAHIRSPSKYFSVNYKKYDGIYSRLDIVHHICFHVQP